MTAWHDEFPEQSAFSVALMSHKLRDAAEACAEIIHRESKLEPLKRNLTPGLRVALREMKKADDHHEIRANY